LFGLVISPEGENRLLCNTASVSVQW